ncbi:hypothetical protein C8J56DRAFT_918586 [Mycena floridula]|nr:hypothetical protein C8J56DRAFT_918586 [Mycena floridula]
MSVKRNELLVRYLSELNSHPLRTKAITSGLLCFLQELLGSRLAGVPVSPTPKNAPIQRALALAHIDAKAAKMALYGFLVSAPLSHYLTGVVQKIFAGRTSTGAKVGHLLASNLVVAPIQTAVYLASLAVINGARTTDTVMKTIKGGFMTVLKVTWVASPLALVFAQKFLPMELWVPFFNLVGFAVGLSFNVITKQMKLKALKKKEEEK